VRAPFFPIVLLAAAALPGCLSNTGDSLPAPTGIQAIVGDGVAGISWTRVPGASYFVFGSTNPNLTANNWTNPGINGFALNNQGTTASSPALVCSNPAVPGAVPNGQDYYFVITAHTGTSPGGPSSPAIKATPRAAGAFWSLGTPLGAAANGAAYVEITACNPAGLQTGLYVAVGATGGIYTSSDAATWTNRTPAGYVSTLNSVTARLATTSTFVNPVLALVAVGANGASITSSDGINWTVGRAANASIPNLNAVTQDGLNFVAVGDNGRIDVSPDGATWVTENSNTAVNLHSVQCTLASNNLYTCVAVGDSGVITVSKDSGATWTAQTINGAPNLRGVAYGNFDNNLTNGILGVAGSTAINTWVAVGDAGALLVNNSGNWVAQSIGTGANLTAITYTTQFAVLDATGNVYLNRTGVGAWQGPRATGIGTAAAITTDGRGYVALGHGGDNASSF
jgi:hypothetical protein